MLDYDGTSGQILRWAAYGPGLDGVLNWMEVAAGTRTTLIPDVQGSVIATLDATGGTMTRTAYLPFGESGTAPAVSGYAGRRYDAETGFYNNRSRIYWPGWGRFLQADPIGTAGGRNLYAYAGNDPLNGTDPSGLWGLGLLVSGSAETGTGVVGAGGTASAGVGVFGGGATGITTGGFVSGGAFAGLANTSAGFPTAPARTMTSVFGAYAGSGVPVFLRPMPQTSANSRVRSRHTP